MIHDNEKKLFYGISNYHLIRLKKSPLHFNVIVIIVHYYYCMHFTVHVSLLRRQRTNVCNVCTRDCRESFVDVYTTCNNRTQTRGIL